MWNWNARRFFFVVFFIAGDIQVLDMEVCVSHTYYIVRCPLSLNSSPGSNHFLWDGSATSWGRRPSPGWKDSEKCIWRAGVNLLYPLFKGSAKPWKMNCIYTCKLKPRSIPDTSSVLKREKQGGWVGFSLPAHYRHPNSHTKLLSGLLQDALGVLWAPLHQQCST